MKYSYLAIGLLLVILFGCKGEDRINNKLTPTLDDGSLFIINSSEQIIEHHTNHFKKYGKNLSGINLAILQAIDIVQAKALDGGSYFIGLTADPPESPIGYNLSLFNIELIEASRKSSYCSGSTYAAFIESLNLIFKNNPIKLSHSRFEALRMQEKDGGRREDEIKFWGKWNDDGYGNHFSLVQYSNIGKRINPKNARPGDFLNISWKNGGGHSVIFLGWYINEQNQKCVVYWSSQKSTNGLGDAIAPIEKIKEVMFVRMEKPENINSFNINKKVDTLVKGDLISW